MAVVLPAFVSDALIQLREAREAEDATDELKALDLRDPWAVSDELSKMGRDKAASWVRDKPQTVSRAFYEGHVSQVNDEGEIQPCTHVWLAHPRALLKDSHRVCEVCGVEEQKQTAHPCKDEDLATIAQEGITVRVCRTCARVHSAFTEG